LGFLKAASLDFKLLTTAKLNKIKNIENIGGVFWTKFEHFFNENLN